MLDSHTTNFILLIGFPKRKNPLQVPWPHPVMVAAWPTSPSLSNPPCWSTETQLLSHLCEVTWDNTSLLWVSGVGRVEAEWEPWDDAHHQKATWLFRALTEVDSLGVLCANTWGVPLSRQVSHTLRNQLRGISPMLKCLDSPQRKGVMVSAAPIQKSLEASEFSTDPWDNVWILTRKGGD